MNKIKPMYCLPIIKASSSEVTKTINKNLKNYHYFEVWLDYIKDLELEFVEKLKIKLNNRLILLFRRQNLETPKMSWRERNKILELLNNSQTLLDLDIFSQKKELEFLKNNFKNIKKIVSYHNYKKTPNQKNLIEIVKNMNKYKPEIYKISTFCQDYEDALRLLGILLQLKNGNLNYIILGMGEKGVITRIFGTTWGNQMTFAPLTLKEKSAPGQLTKDQLSKIFKNMYN